MTEANNKQVSCFYGRRKRSQFFAMSALCIVYSILGSALLVKSEKADSTLRFVSVLHRHGMRTPIFTYPTDPYQNQTQYWPQGYGELLNEGKRQLFKVGKFLRSRYDEYLPSAYKSSQVYVRSVPSNRCVMSGQLLLAGLYSPDGDQVWNDELRWQPIPVYPLAISVDDMLGVTKPCPLLSQEQDYVKNHRLRKELDDREDLVETLTNKTGKDMSDVHQLELLYDTLLVQSENGLELPEWTDGIFPDKLLPLSLLSFSALTETSTMKKLICGVLINDILSSMKSKRALKGDFELLLNLYSAQDRTIISMWRSMGIRQDLPKPNYGASLIFELHEVDGNWRVKLLYKNSASEDELSIVNIDGCQDDEDQHSDGMCDLDLFADRLKNVTVADFDKDCQTSD